jgi:2-amino-4-hydroxy-6-hydroxymethyldihydropteridine diphosphokinase
MAIAYVGLGSNLGDRADNIRRALDMLDQTDGLSIVAVSSLYETEPEDYEDQDWFVNAAAQIEIPLSPRELLNLLKEIERTIGRIRTSVRWGPREIDLDLLLYDQLCFESSDLTVPHPRMHQRAFVLVPLAEIAADVLHPILGKTVGDLSAELQTSKTVRRLEDATGGM